MNSINPLHFLLSGILKNEPLTSSNEISQEIPLESSTRQTFSKCNPYPSPVLSSPNVTTVSLLPRHHSSSMAQRRQHHRIGQSNTQKQYQPLLNSSTLDDLFRALTLECEQYIASATVANTLSYQNKDCDKTIVPSSTKIQTSVESNDDDYENLHTSISSQPITNYCAPLKTSIEVISPIKRHVVSITITSKISSPQSISPEKPSNNTASVITPTICHSSEEDSVKMSSSNTNRKRRRRARKQILSSSITRSSSSSNERKEIINNDKRSTISKRSCSTDPVCQRNRNLYHNNFISYSSSQKQRRRYPCRRDASLQHSFPIPERNQKNHSLPLSVLLTSTKGTSDFSDNLHRQQQRPSCLGSVYHKRSTLPDRMHQKLYCSLPARNNHTKSNIRAHHIRSYPVY